MWIVFCVFLDMIISFSICPFRWCSFHHSIIAFFWMRSNSQPAKCSLCSQSLYILYMSAAARVQRNHTNFENSQIQLCFIRYHKYFVWLECDCCFVPLYRSFRVDYGNSNMCVDSREIKLKCLYRCAPPIECIYSELNNRFQQALFNLLVRFFSSSSSCVCIRVCVCTKYTTSLTYL